MTPSASLIQSATVGCNRVDLLVLRDDDAESDSDSRDGNLGESSWDDLESIDEFPVPPTQHTLNLSLLLGLDETAPAKTRPNNIKFDTDASTDASDAEYSSDSDTRGSEHRMAVAKFQPPPGLPPPFGPPPGLPVPLFGKSVHILKLGFCTILVKFLFPESACWCLRALFCTVVGPRIAEFPLLETLCAQYH